ncbi:hypothetical protein FHR83_007091 [Actinoplanes campanulatus]|uniref:Uncharacterized protein n=1 Tax=Actinoplanes campanulatus TaxID=113559 RepID=A0A7W5FIE3_9ACTN|nr:hypothetical protein [Actinoplanes campanulatus]MBB3099385.1 hypothetical protein [Actinoplanes campanulatus]GGN40206.1 hypothetical protein GCM10010109_69010 [Actinoplanes campanulatus]GID42406.1 hypothetical protein Aca09nite_89120 [Actinoplanes campanulatus]
MTPELRLIVDLRDLWDLKISRAARKADETGLPQDRNAYLWTCEEAHRAAWTLVETLAFYAKSGERGELCLICHMDTARFRTIPARVFIDSVPADGYYLCPNCASRYGTGMSGQTFLNYSAQMSRE